MQQLYTLIEDRTWNNEGIKYCTRGTHNDCFEWILKHTSYSFSLATTEGGYRLLPYKIPCNN